MIFYTYYLLVYAWPAILGFLHVQGIICDDVICSLITQGNILTTLIKLLMVSDLIYSFQRDMKKNETV